MKLENELSIGAAGQEESSYFGRHRSMHMNTGIGYFPLGDRNRDKPQYGVTTVEERDSDANIWRI